MFFKKKPDPEKMDAIAESIGGFIKISLEVAGIGSLSDKDQAVADCFLFGAVELMAQSNKMGSTQTISQIAGLVLTKYLAVDMDSAWDRVLSMAAMSNDRAGQEIMSQGAKSFLQFIRNENPSSVFVLSKIIGGDYFAVK